MVAAILQGVPGSTLDTDIWIGLPERQYMRVQNLARSLQAKSLAPTLFVLRDETMITLLFRVDGLKSFNVEYKKRKKVEVGGVELDILPLESILASKEFLMRPKDLAHLPLLRQVIGMYGRKPKD